MRALDELLAKARQDPRVVAVLMFGSRARGEEDARDTDVALVLRPEAVPAASDIRLAYASEDAALDVQVFQGLPLHIQARVLSEAKVLVATDEDAMYDAAFAALRAWEDMAGHVRAYLEVAGLA